MIKYCKLSFQPKQIISLLLALVVLISGSSILSLANDDNPITPIAPEDYYGRTQLSTLSNSESLIYAYDQIAKGVEVSSNKIDLSNKTKNYHINYDEFQTVLNAYLCDYPQHFWLGKQYSYGQLGGHIVTFSPTYILQGEALSQAKKEFNQAVKLFLNGINKGMSEVQMEEYLHDAIATNTEYVSTDNAHNAYGCLVENQAVCEGYAEAFQYLLYQVGILNVLVTGSSKVPNSDATIGHAWNLVCIDGEYYYVDVTWNDQAVGTFHEYFNITTELLLEDHVIDEPVYGLPVCTATEANFFTVHGGSVYTFSVSEVIDGFNQTGDHLEIFLPNNSYEFWKEFSNHYSEILKGMDFVDKPSFVCYSLGHERYVKFTGHRRGDVNEDALFNMDDLSVLQAHLDNSAPLTDPVLLKAADMDKDSQVTQEDYRLLYLRIVGTEPPAEQPEDPPVDPPDDPSDENPEDPDDPSGDDPKDPDDPSGDDPKDPDDPSGDDPKDPDDPSVDDPKDPDDPSGDDPKDPDDPSGDDPKDPDDPNPPAIELMGDLNADGKLDATDALAVLKNAVGKLELTAIQLLAADLNNDNAINAADALIILLRAVGK